MADNSRKKKTVSSQKSKQSKKMVGKYQVINKIAEGGMGAVFKGIHPTLNRYIILKRLSSHSKTSLSDRFKREAKIMMDFKNEHIAQVYDHFKEGSSYYIIEEFIDGYALGDLIKKERYLSDEAALLIMVDCCKALKYAHDKNVVHRDIKPANIIISKKGEVKLVDFGIASSLDDADEGLTRDGMVLGTPAYMSPEQIKDTKTVDKRADIYSLGVMLYEMVTGKAPFPGNFTPESIALIVNGKYKPVHKVNPKVSPFVRKIIKKMMHFKIKKRYQDLGKVLDIIRKRLAQKNERNYNSQLKDYLLGKPIENVFKKSRAKLAILMCLLIALLGGGTFTLLFIYEYNFYYELLWPKEYGTFKLSVTVAKGRKNLDETFLNAYVYKEKEIEGSEELSIFEQKLIFSPADERETEEYYVLESQKVYLPSDQYKLSINYENNYIFKSFYLNPRDMQKNNIEVGDYRRIEVDLSSVSGIPLNIDYTVVNANTGVDITRRTDSYVYKSSRWKDLNDVDNGDLVSGREYSFKFEKDGYFTGNYITYIEPFSRSLEINIELVPKPGKINLTSNHDGLSIMINDSSNYQSYEENNIKYMQIPSTSKEGREILLAPGEYLITVTISEEIKDNISVELGADETINIDLEYDRANKKIGFSVIE